LKELPHRPKRRDISKTVTGRRRTAPKERRTCMKKATDSAEAHRVSATLREGIFISSGIASKSYGTEDFKCSGMAQHSKGEIRDARQGKRLRFFNHNESYDCKGEGKTGGDVTRYPGNKLTPRYWKEGKGRNPLKRE